MMKEKIVMIVMMTIHLISENGREEFLNKNVLSMVDIR